MNQPPKILVFGAGSIGCYIGARLWQHGADVTLLGRPRLQQVLQQNPIVISDYLGYHNQTEFPSTRYITDISQAPTPDIVLVTVKSADSESAATALAPFIRPDTIVISLQNGVSNADRMGGILSNNTVLKGIVVFNVAQQAEGHFHQGTEGAILIEDHAGIEPLLTCFEQAGLSLQSRSNMQSVLWSKLLLNLNNPINALSGIPLLEQLSQRHYRRCLALLQEEALQLLKTAGIPTTKVTALPLNWLPTILRLPNWLYTRIAAQALKIDPLARSSMWQDLQAGRKTEIDFLNGELVNLAHTLGCEAPVNQKLVELIHAAERSGQAGDISGAELLEQLSMKRK